MSERYTTAICVAPPSTAAGTAMVSGIEAYVRRFSLPWCVTEVEDPNRLGSLMNWFAPKQSAMVGMLRSEALVKRALGDGMVLVSASISDFPGIRMAKVLPDPDAIGRAALEYLLAAGYKTPAVWDVAKESPSHPRIEAFCRHARKTGTPVLRLTPSLFRSTNHGEDAAYRLLAGLPAGTALFLHSDHVASWCRECCLAAGIDVPGHVALLGSDNDTTICLRREPALSSVRVPWRLLGERLAAVAHVGISGGEWRDIRETIPPFGVVERASTRRSAKSGDSVSVVAASKVAVSLDELASGIHKSRRTAERRFKARYGTSLRKWQLARRVEKAAELLMNSDLSIADIAKRSGFKSYQTFGRAVRARFGYSPSAIRGNQPVPPTHP